jgi:iron complex outermembrane receptor protein
MFGGNEYITYNADGTPAIATSKAEKANDWELGTEYVTDGFKFNVNLFYMKFKDELVLNGEFGLNGLPQHENAKSSKRYGVEVSEYWNVWDGLNFNNTFSLSKNKVSTETFGDNMNSILSPSIIWNTDLSWEKPTYGVGLNFNFYSKMHVDMSNEHYIPNSCTFNLYGNIKFSKALEFIGKINNIFNRTNYCSGAVGASNETLYCPLAGTNVMGIFKINF